MHQYSIFPAPLFSFYSKKFYGETARFGKGTGFLYLFLLLVVCHSLSAWAGYIHFTFLVDSPAAKEIYTKIPDMTVKQGVLSINKPSPYLMEFKNATTQEKSVVVFDTRGNAKLPDDAKALVTEKGIIFDNDQPPVEWSSMGDFDLNTNKIKESLDKVGLYLAYGSLLLLPIVYIGHLLLALIYGGVGSIMDKQNLGYATALRMSCVAMTPAMVVTTLFYVAFGSMEMVAFLLLWEMLSVPITIGYLFFGYSSISSVPAE
jgi:hypothetical protein